MSAQQEAPVDSVVLVGDEVLRARAAVRKYLAKVRHSYRSNRRQGAAHYAASDLRRFDDYLDLYELLGGNPDEITDPQEATQ